MNSIQAYARTNEQMNMLAHELSIHRGNWRERYDPLDLRKASIDMTGTTFSFKGKVTEEFMKDFLSRLDELHKDSNKRPAKKNLRDASNRRRTKEPLGIFSEIGT